MDFIYFIELLEGQFLSSWRQDREFFCSVKQTPILPRSNFISCLFFIANNFEPFLNGPQLI